MIKINKKQKIKDKIIEISKLGLTDKATYHSYEDVYPHFYDDYLKDGRFEVIDLRKNKGRGDDIIDVYYKK